VRALRGSLGSHHIHLFCILRRCHLLCCFFLLLLYLDLQHFVSRARCYNIFFSQKEYPAWQPIPSSPFAYPFSKKDLLRKTPSWNSCTLTQYHCRLLDFFLPLSHLPPFFSFFFFANVFFPLPNLITNLNYEKKKPLQKADPCFMCSNLLSAIHTWALISILIYTQHSDTLKHSLSFFKLLESWCHDDDEIHSPPCTFHFPSPHHTYFATKSLHPHVSLPLFFVIFFFPWWTHVYVATQTHPK